MSKNEEKYYLVSPITHCPNWRVLKRLKKFKNTRILHNAADRLKQSGNHTDEHIDEHTDEHIVGYTDEYTD